MKILIIKLSAIGDVIHTLPSLNAIRKRWPDAQITWIVEEAASPLIIGHPALNRVIVSRRKAWAKGLKSGSFREKREAINQIRKFLKDLRDTEYDLVIDFQQLLKSGIIAALAKGRFKAGYDHGMAHMEGSYRFLNCRIPAISMNIHALKRSLMLVEKLGIPVSEIRYDVPVKDEHRRRVHDLLKDHQIDQKKRLIGVNPMTQWKTKLWSEEKFAALADRIIRELNAEVVFTGSPDDAKILERIIKMMKKPAANLGGKTSLIELAALYERMDLLVSTDTGPMHLAAAMGKPAVALFGSTAPWRTGPFGSGHRILRSGMECSPCFRRNCDHKSCMERISVEAVYREVEEVIGSRL